MCKLQNLSNLKNLGSSYQACGNKGLTHKVWSAELNFDKTNNFYKDLYDHINLRLYIINILLFSLYCKKGELLMLNINK